MRTAVIYATKSGHTRAAAEYIAVTIGADAIDLKKDKSPDIGAYDRIIIGSGVYAGKMSKKVRRFVEQEVTELPSKNVVLFLTCKTDGEKGDEQLAKIAADMPFLSSKTYFTGVDKDAPSAHSGIAAFVEELKDQ